jgi:hypothetical protein
MNIPSELFVYLVLGLAAILPIIIGLYGIANTADTESKSIHEQGVRDRRLMAAMAAAYLDCIGEHDAADRVRHAE